MVVRCSHIPLHRRLCGDSAIRQHSISQRYRNNYEAYFRPAQTRILFVEDEDSVRTFGIRALQKKGYEVIGCSSGENALEFIEKDNNFNLLITDMVMPGISGAELTKQLKNKLPNLKVILASGYSEEIVRQELENFDDFDFITKPYSLGDLTAKVFDVLNRD